MTAIEELLESTLNRAASEVGAPAGFADRAVASAGRIQRRRRAAGATGVAVIAVAAVAIAAVTGSSGERRAAPVESPTPVSSVSATNLISGSPTPSETDTSPTSHRPSAVTTLAGLNVLFSDHATIHDGARTIELHPTVDWTSSIQALARLGDGYVVSLEDSSEEILARVDRAGNIHRLDDQLGDNAGGAQIFAVSSDETSIAYARWKLTSKGVVSTIRLIDASGHLLRSVTKAGAYQAQALFPGQVWLRSLSDDATQPPAVWDLARNTVQDVDLGPQTIIDAVDLPHGRVALNRSDCGLNVVATDRPRTVVADRCNVVATSFSPDGSLILAQWTNANNRTHFYVLNSHDLSTQWSKTDLPFFSLSSWTSDGRLVGYDVISRLVIVDLKRHTVTVKRVSGEPDGFAMAPNS